MNFWYFLIIFFSGQIAGAMLVIRYVHTDLWRAKEELRMRQITYRRKQIDQKLTKLDLEIDEMLDRRINS